MQNTKKILPQVVEAKLRSSLRDTTAATKAHLPQIPNSDLPANVNWHKLPVVHGSLTFTKVLTVLGVPLNICHVDDDNPDAQKVIECKTDDQFGRHFFALVRKSFIEEDKTRLIDGFIKYITMTANAQDAAVVKSDRGYHFATITILPPTGSPGAAVTVPVYTRYLAQTNEEYAAFLSSERKAAAEKGDDQSETEIRNRTVETVNGFDIIVGIVADDHPAGRSLFLMYKPEYEVIALVRESHIEADRTDLFQAHKAMIEREKVAAYFESEALIIEVPNDDCRAGTTVYSATLKRYIHRVRESYSKPDTRMLSESLDRMFTVNKADAAQEYREIVIEGGTPDAE